MQKKLSSTILLIVPSMMLFQVAAVNSIECYHCFSIGMNLFSGLIGGTVQTGVDQFVNNEINDKVFGGGLGSNPGPGNDGGFF